MPESGGAFFGRRKGKTVRPARRDAVRRALPALLVDLAAPPPEPLSGLFAIPVTAVRVEIGFGGGEHLVHEAKSFPVTGFIGIEPFENGLAKAVVAIARDELPNVRLFNQDAAALLDWLPAGSLERLDLLYPDPWPKTRHWKRRFVSAANLDRIVRVLQPGGVFRFASDVEAYVAWTLREVARHGGLTWTESRVEACRTPWAGWPGTRYEAKALSEGRRPAYLTFSKPGPAQEPPGPTSPA